MRTGTKLILGGAVVVATTGYMGYLGASTSWQYYVTTEECLQQADELSGTRLRVSGRVAAGSLQTASDGSQAELDLVAAERSLHVVCQGPLPDNLVENMDVVVEGRLGPDGVLHGTKLLTRCASKYESEHRDRTEGHQKGAS